ncbi:MAG: filamentous hemagglutinin N-terminal domain-containing protein, partial [Cyanobacteria bacterium J06641_2]
AFIYYGNTAVAQITPDQTLGKESSIVTPVSPNVDRIDGGAVRGSNLFQSFQEFNVGEGRRVDFANPTGVENIFSRVTGNNPSNIFGTLGVLGDANLFFLNPNGIIFGSNAQLDIRGSFVASTANSFSFADGAEYSATNPKAPPLLKVNFTPGLQIAGKSPGALVNEGNLIVGKDLTLWGGSVTSKGQLAAPLGNLTVEAVLGDAQIRNVRAETAKLSASGNLILSESQLGTTGDLSLLAQNTLRVRDSVTNPFVAQAGGKLLVQGNQGIDIFALNHPDSGFASGGDMVLRSANTVGGDAHYWSGGGFKIENLDGNLGDLYSPYDPIIRSQGDVKFSKYEGSSLHILSGGSVDIESVLIETNDTVGDTINPISTPDLAYIKQTDGTPLVIDGTPLVIDGNKQPTLDVRAGMNAAAIGTPLGISGYNLSTKEPVEAFFDSSSVLLPPDNNPNITGSDININNAIVRPNGLIFLRGENVNINGILATDRLIVDSKNNIEIQSGLGVSKLLFLKGGNVNIDSKTSKLEDILITNRLIIDSKNNITINSPIWTSGDISFFAGQNIILRDSSSLLYTSSNSGNAGNITLVAGKEITLKDSSSVISGGNSGKIDIKTESLKLTEDSQIG